MSLAETIDVEALARHIAVRMDPEALLDAEDVGAILRCTARYVKESYTRAPGFPKAIRLPGPDAQKSQPRWRRSHIMAWIEANEDGKTTRGGRRRNNLGL